MWMSLGFTHYRPHEINWEAAGYLIYFGPIKGVEWKRFVI